MAPREVAAVEVVEEAVAAAATVEGQVEADEAAAALVGPEAAAEEAAGDRERAAVSMCILE